MDNIPARADAPNASADLERQSVARVRRGHHPKIAQAVEALRREGNLPRHLRPVERDRRVVEWLKANGYATDLPKRSALARYFMFADAT
jgi:hypothetical protein